MIRDDFRSEEARKAPAGCARPACGIMAISDVLIAQTSDTAGPFALDRRAAFEFEAQFLKEAYRHAKVFDDNPDVVHSLRAPCSASSVFGPISFQDVDEPSVPTSLSKSLGKISDGRHSSSAFGLLLLAFAEYGRRCARWLGRLASKNALIDVGADV